MRLFVSGASGLIGTELRDVLRQHEHQVVQLVRHDPSFGEVGWDPDHAVLDPADLKGADGFIHLSGESIAGHWTDERKRRMVESRVKSTTLLARTIARLDPKPAVLVCASAIGYYGDRGDEILTEESRPGRGFLAELCQKWEQATRPAADAGIRVVNLRIGMVLSRRGGALAKVLPIFKLGAGGIVGSGRQYWSWVRLRDLALMIEFCAVDDELHGPVNAVSGSCTNREFTQTLGRVLHRPTPFPLPAFLAKLILGEMADQLLLASARVEPVELQEAQYPFLDADLESALRAATT